MKPFIPREWIRMRKQPYPTAILYHVDQFGTAVFTDGKCVRAPHSPGEVCWVRETFTAYRTYTDAETARNLKVLERIVKGDDGGYGDLKNPTGEIKVLYKADFGEWADDPDCDLGPWRSPFTMPQWASRRHVRILSCVPEQRDVWGWKVEWEESNAL